MLLQGKILSTTSALCFHCNVDVTVNILHCCLSDSIRYCSPISLSLSEITKVRCNHCSLLHAGIQQNSICTITSTLCCHCNFDFAIQENSIHVITTASCHQCKTDTAIQRNVIYAITTALCYHRKLAVSIHENVYAITSYLGINGLL